MPPGRDGTEIEYVPSHSAQVNPGPIASAIKVEEVKQHANAKQKRRKSTSSKKSSRRSSKESKSSSPKITLINNNEAISNAEAIFLASKKWKRIAGGDYLLTEQILGKGSFGVVQLGYKATHPLRMDIEDSQRQKVAVKVVSKEDPKKVEAFLKETDMLKQVGNGHPNLIHLYCVCEDDEFTYVVLQHKSCDLYSYIERNRRLTETVAMKILAQLVDGVSFLHSRGIAHRDIKLENILIDEDTLEVSLADFGFATLYAPDEKLSKWCGSPYTVSPEIISHIPYWPEKVDVWALGSVLYTMLCGQFPFQTDTINEVLRKTKANRMNPFHRSLGASSKDLIKTMMTFDMDKRPSFDQLKQHAWMRFAMVTKRRISVSNNSAASTSSSAAEKSVPEKKTKSPRKV